MITKEEVLSVGSKAIRQTFSAWPDENKQEIIHLVAQAVARPLASPAPKKETEKPAGNLPKPFLIAAQLAERWDCCTHTVKRKIRMGELPCIYMSRRRVLIPMEAVLKYEKDATYQRS